MISPSLTLVLATLSAGLALVTLLGYLGRLWWCFDLLSHFRVQYGLLAGSCALVSLLTNQLGSFVVCLGIGLLNLAPLHPLYRRHPNPVKPEQTYRLLSANILGSNRSFEQLTHLLAKENPDLVLWIEYDHRHVEGLRPAVAGFAHSFTYPRHDNYGLALLSQLPLATAEIRFLNADHVPVLIARVEIEGRLLTIITSHPPPPKRQWMSKMRDRQLLALARLAAEQKGEVILAGDFNTTQWSHSFRDFLHASRLLDSQAGFGLQTTWPAHLPLFRVPIDHVFHTPGIQITQRRTGPFTGSDHRPILIDFGLQSDTSSENLR